MAAAKIESATWQQPHGKDVQVLGLDDAVCDGGHHRLHCSGRGGQEENHLGPRHAIREARVQKLKPLSTSIATTAARLALCACAMHVLPKTKEPGGSSIVKP